HADGFPAIMAGSPGFQVNRGRVNLIFGRPATPNPPGQILGPIDLSNLPTAIGNVEFRGAAAGSLAGFSETAVGLINNDTVNEIAIGAPGVNTGSGAVFLIPGNPSLTSPPPITLSTTGIETPAIAGQTLTVSST